MNGCFGEERDENGNNWKQGKFLTHGSTK